MRTEEKRRHRYYQELLRKVSNAESVSKRAREEARKAQLTADEANSQLEMERAANKSNWQDQKLIAELEKEAQSVNIKGTRGHEDVLRSELDTGIEEKGYVRFAIDE